MTQKFQTNQQNKNHYATNEDNTNPTQNSGTIPRKAWVAYEK